MKLILLGAPGAGKGTQAEAISRQLGIPAISTGNIIREALQSGSPLGLAAKAYLESGALVPDEVVIGIVEERVAQPDCARGFILDGFPRTIAQAEALEQMGLDADLVLSLELEDGIIEERLSGRRICQSCGASYHIQYNPSSKGDACNLCDGPLISRQDDQPETIRQRLAVFHKQTEPLKEYYRERGRLRCVDSQERVEDTTALVLSALKEAAI